MPNKKYAVPVLIINSSDTLQDKIEQKVAQLNCLPSFCQTGEQALALLAENEIKLILSNIRFDDMTVSEFLKSIPCQSYNCPVIVFADKPQVEELLPLLRLGVRDCIVDPLKNIDDISSTIEWAIESHTQQIDNLRLEDTNRELQKDLSGLQIDLQAGRYVQRKMLPDTPKRFGNYEFSHHLIPSSYLSGDFVEYVLVGSRYVTFLIADVSGHGASSAFITVLIKNITARLRSDWTHKEDSSIISPASFLSKINEEFIALESGKHATMFVGVIDLQEHCLLYSVAGHHPMPVISEPQKGARAIVAKGRPVGLFPDYEFQEHKLSLPQEFKLLLFSDGILEVLPQEYLKDKEHFLLEACKYENLESVQALEERLELKPQQHLPDDVAILLLSYPN